MHRVTGALLQPLQARLAELDHAIALQQSKVRAVKATTLENEAKIARAMAAIASAGARS